MTHALLIIDVQNDFTEGGALGVDGGHSVASGITALLAAHRDVYDLVVASRDWHDGDSDNGGHFAPAGTEPDFVETWPVHCVADTEGAAYDPGFDTAAVDVHIRKGQGVPAYSIFEGTDAAGSRLGDVLTERGVTSLDVVGIATDYCVRASVLDAVAHGQHVRVFTDLVAGVAPESSETALAELAHAGVELAESSALGR